MQQPEKIALIVNPVSGSVEPILKPCADLLNQRNIDYQFYVTTPTQAVTDFASSIMAYQPDIVVAIGGDGTLCSVVTQFASSEIPVMAIPGGTGNALAKKLNIPQNVPDALRVQLDSLATASFDLGTLNGEPFFMRISTDWIAEFIRHASREDKNNLGTLAYPKALLDQLSTLKEKEYHFTLDGTEHRYTATGMMIVNWGPLGMLGLDIAPEGTPADGLFDIILLKLEGLADLASAAKRLLFEEQVSQVVTLQGKSLEVHNHSQSPFQLRVDDVPMQLESLKCEIQPGAASLVVPTSYQLS